MKAHDCLTRGDAEQALEFFQQIVSQLPNDFETHTNMGVLLRRLGNLPDAERAYKKAISLNPRWPAALYNLANLYRHIDRHEEAIVLYQKAIAAKPDYGEAFNNLASSLLDLNQDEEALKAAREAVRLDPASTLPLINLGRSLNRLGRFGEATSIYQQALKLEPKQYDAMRGLAHALGKSNRIPEAISLYQRVLKGCPDAGPKERFNISLLYLLNGNFEAGWKGYDNRLAFEKYAVYQRRFTNPDWNGEPLKGAKILVYSEQGRGDAIQFIRYAPMIVERGGEVILECYPELAPLFQGASGVSALEIKGEGNRLYRHHVSLMSLPRIFGANPATIPAPNSYLSPPNLYLARWRSQIPDEGKRKIGLVWRGSPSHGDDENRSLSPVFLEPLLGVGNVDFYSLQKEVTPADRKALDRYSNLTFLGDGFEDFGDTAAAIACLDLVITVDTGVAHLAGALGKPVWILLPFSPDWRWLLDRSDSPWYPSARLFRQDQRRDWETVISEVVSRLTPSTSQSQSVDDLRSKALVLVNENRLEEARNLLEILVQREPGDVEAYSNLGVILRRLGKLTDAEAAYRKAISIKPDWAGPYFNLGNLLNQLGRFDDAIAAFVLATEKNPDYGDAFNNLAFTLATLRRGEEALAACNKLVKLLPDRAATYNNLGKTHSLLGHYGEAVGAYNKALTLMPEMADAHNGLGFVYRQMNEIEKAEKSYHQAIKHQPGEAAQEKFNLSILYLLTGRYREGWQLHEWRLRLGEHAAYRNRFPDADWDGTPLKGEDILLYCEQGRGDAIQFIRYAPQVAERGGRVIVECHEELAGLLGRADGVSEVEKRGCLERRYKNHVSLMSLAKIFETTLDSLPAAPPYLCAPEDKKAAWQKRFSRFRKTKVAIAWQGAADHGNDHNRSIRLETITPLLKTKSARFFNFQKELPKKDEEALASIRDFNHVAADFEDFEDTAAALEQMDLLITVDTAIAHLGGALGIETWVLLPFSPDWRWLLEGSDSPWYPSMKLFRQDRARNWADVVESVKDELIRRFGCPNTS